MQIGQTVGQYLITASLGEGAMGKVYRGRDIQLNRDVAIKVLRPEISSRPDLVERFRNEAMTLASLHHGNVCSVYAFVEHEGQHAMVLQHLEGKPLEDVLRENGRVGWPEAKRILRDVLSGLQEAHAAGIVHRDLKPANLMVTPLQKVVIMDFGIARVKNQQRATREGMMVGTLEYASPEQIRGEDVDPRSDLYSLGIIAYEMLSGRLPFDAKTDYEWVKAQTTQDPDFAGLSDRYGRSVVQFLRKVLEKSPAKRFDTAQAMDAALEALRESSRPSLPSLGIPGMVQDTAASLSAVTKKSSGLVALAKENLVLVAAGTLILVGVGFVALTHLQQPSSTSPPVAPQGKAAVSAPATTSPLTPPAQPVPTATPTVAQPDPPVPRPITPPPSGEGKGRISIGTEGGERPMSMEAPSPAAAPPQAPPAEKPARPKGNYDFKF